MAIRPAPLPQRLWRRVRRSAVVRVLGSHRTLAAFVLGTLAGFTTATLAVVGDKPRDWNFLLVLITSIYVALTFLLLRAGARQAAAAEKNVQLLQQQLVSDARRKAGPIAVLAREVQENVRAWESALRENRTSNLPPLLPEH